jgi:uncharacterized protein
MARPAAAIGPAALLPFLAISFGLSWGLVGLYLAFPGPITRLFGPVGITNPLFLLAVYAPAIAAIVLVLRHGGTAGLRRFLSRVLLWRAPAAWWALILVGIPLIYWLGALAKGMTLAEFFPVTAPGALLAGLALMALIGPVEEFGWRGFAMPLLQQRLAPLWAGLVLGAVWGLWHLPAFFLAGTPQSAWPVAPFLVGAVAVSVMVAPLFNAARGSILLPALFHLQLNNPAWPDSQPWDTPFFVGAAVLVVWLNRRTMFTRGGAVTEVIPPPRP